MLNARHPAARFAASLRDCRSGLAFIEFAFALPVVLALGLLGLETANYAVANLRVSNTVQHHVRDHIKDFVNFHRSPGRWPFGLADRPWIEPLYVDTRGLLRRTDDSPAVRKARRRR